MGRGEDILHNHLTDMLLGSKAVLTIFAPEKSSNCVTPSILRARELVNSPFHCLDTLHCPETMRELQILNKIALLA